MAEEKKPSGRSRKRGETRAFTLELPATLDDALECRAEQDRRSKKAVVVIALEQYLAKEASG